MLSVKGGVEKFYVLGWAVYYVPSRLEYLVDYYLICVPSFLGFHSDFVHGNFKRR